MLAGYSGASNDIDVRIQDRRKKCEGAGKSDCWKKLEREAIRVVKDEVRRQGVVLTIQTRDRQIVFRSIPDSSPEPTSYYYIGDYAEIGYHLVERWKYFEDLSYLLISKTTGKTTVLPEIPHVSPSSRHVVVVHGSEGAGGSPSQIAIWSVDPDRLTEQYRYLPKEYFLPSFKSWEIDDEVTLSAYTYSWAGRQCKSLGLVWYQLRKSGASWNLTIDPNKALPECK
ncbi:MAG: hypothetical protein HYX45_11785 [Burkholderiales bacterium]|nr:hypothetical protein [Burkholderiales bacterium]